MEGTWGRVWILLFSDATLFEYNVSTILSPIVVTCEKSAKIRLVQHVKIKR